MANFIPSDFKQSLINTEQGIRDLIPLDMREKDSTMVEYVGLLVRKMKRIAKFNNATVTIDISDATEILDNDVIVPRIHVMSMFSGINVGIGVHQYIALSNNEIEKYAVMSLSHSLTSSIAVEIFSESTYYVVKQNGKFADTLEHPDYDRDVYEDISLFEFKHNAGLYMQRLVENVSTDLNNEYDISEVMV